MAHKVLTDGERGESVYSRKKRYCDRHGVYGFQVPEPKPWKMKPKGGAV